MTSIVLFLSITTALSDNIPNISTKKEYNEWTCPNCGYNAKGNFCSNCGSPNPENIERITEQTTPTNISTEVPMDNLHINDFTITLPQGFLKMKDETGVQIYPFSASGDNKSLLYVFVNEITGTEEEYAQLVDILPEMIIMAINNQALYTVKGSTIPIYHTDKTYAGIKGCHYYEFDITYSALLTTSTIKVIVIYIEKDNKLYMFRISSEDALRCSEIVNFIDNIKWD